MASAPASLERARSSRRQNHTTAGRVPPYNLQAEESLLGAMLLSRDAIAAAVEICSADHFYKPAHGHVYDAICSLYAAGEGADPVTVADELRRAHLLDAIGGPATLITLQANTPATTNAGRYARIVEEHALLRRMISVAGEIAEIGYSVPEDVTAAVDEAETLVFEVADRRVTDSLHPIHELLSPALDRLEKLYERGDTITGLATGYLDLDELLSGLQASNLIILGGRPSAGKSAFAFGAAAHAALDQHATVLLFSLEMSHSEITQRLLCSEARVDSTRIRNGKLQESDWPKISHAIGRLGEAPLYIDDNPNLSVMEIRAKARRLQSRIGKIGLIVVDYIQLMTGRSNAENRQVEVSEISRGLKILARELDVPVLALSQLSRNLEMRADKRPMLADLRESGCMPASVRLQRADNTEVTLGELVASGEQPMVWSIDDTGQVVARRLIRAFASGIKTVYRIRLTSGLHVDATANHRFRTPCGWRRLDELHPGDLLAVAPLGHADHSLLVGAGAGRLPHGPIGSDRRRDPEGPRPSPGRPAAWGRLADAIRIGDMETYDATVEGTHNFIAEGIVAHNSLEQDADVVMFVYRDEVYNPESPDRGTAEIIVAKQRNGPTGVAHLAFLAPYTRFANVARV